MTDAMVHIARSFGREWLCGLLLVALTVLAYLPALDGGFLWDDGAHILDIEALQSLQGLRDIWFKPGATIQYYPLTFTVFWIDYHLWGFSPFVFHLQNVLLHGLSAVLLWQVLASLRLQGALLAGVIFALHPVNVMSVAWMTELKNTLSCALALGAILAYVRFAGLGVYSAAGYYQVKDASGSRIAWRYYVLSLTLFLLAMLAKSAVSFLPATLLLVMLWQRDRVNWRDLFPLIPMFGVAVTMGGFTIFVERHFVKASGVEFSLSFVERLLVSGRSFWFYLEKLFFPNHLTFIYQRWDIRTGDLWQYLYPLAAVTLLGGLWVARSRFGKGPWAAAMHFYVSTSMLVLVTVLYMMRYSFVSDHWQYFGCMSVIGLTAAGIAEVISRCGPRARLSGIVVILGMLLALGVLTWRQCAMYADIETLWQTTIRRNPNCWIAYNNLGNEHLGKGKFDEAMIHYQSALDIKPDFAEAHNNLGCALLQKGGVDEAIVHYQKALEIKPDFAEAQSNVGYAFLQKGSVDEAIVHYQKALEIKPDYAVARYNLGSALFQKGELQEATIHLQKALEIKPDYAEAHNNLGSTLLRKGELEEAIVHFQKAQEIRSDYAEAHNNLGSALLQKGGLDEAIVHYQKALEIKPDYAEVHNNLGNALLQKSGLEEAIVHFQRALAIKPNYVEAHNNLGSALLQKGGLEEAIVHFQKALEIMPINVAAQNNLAWALATAPRVSLRNGNKAVVLAQEANQLSGGLDPMILRTLAAAYAETRRFSEAVKTAQRALQVADFKSNTALEGALRREIELYKASAPFRAPSPD